MNEAVFPLVGPVLVFVFALPATALIARSMLYLLRKLETARGIHAHHGVRYAILVASSTVPLAWFVSASLHQSETGASAVVCAAVHAPGAFCTEAAYFSLALLVLAGASALPRLIREQFLLRASVSPAARRAHVRLLSLVAADSTLGTIRDRLVVSDTAAPIATLGVLSPRVVVRTAFADALDDEALSGALHHELEHVRGRDPMRYFLAWWALAVNPFGRWLLRADHSRWLLAREAHCDREAVLSGASAPALAHALVRAARPLHPAVAPALGAGHVEGVKLRVGLLLGYADRTPERCYHGPALRFVLVLLALVFLLPHRSGTEPLDVLHEASESAASLVIGTSV